MSETTKVCKKCEQEKPIKQFQQVKRRGALYRRNTCRQCARVSATKKHNMAACSYCEKVLHVKNMHEGMCAPCYKSRPIITQPTPVMVFESILQAARHDRAA